MIRRELDTPLDAALAAAAAQLAASGADEEWILPAGDNLLADAVAVDAGARSLALIGGADTTLRFSQGGLALAGERVAVSAMTVVAEGLGAGAALSIAAGRAEVSGVRVTARGSDTTGLRVAARERAAIADCAVRGLRSTGDVRGVELAAPQLRVTGLRVSDLRGDAADALVLACFGGGDSVLDASDVTVEDVTARAGLCRGIAAFTAGAARLRGFSARAVEGETAHALSAVAAGSIEVASGTVFDVRGSGSGAAGIRVVATDADSPVAVRDVAVEYIGGTAPATEARPHPEITAWGEASAAAIRSPGFELSGLPAFPDAARSEVVGVHVGAVADALAWARSAQPRAVAVEDVVIHRIAGTALQLEAGLRPAQVRRAELWTAARAGWVQAENLLVAELTAHRHLAPLRIGPGDARVFNALFSGIESGAAPVLDADAELVEVAATFATGAAPPWTALEGELPYREPGPATAPASLADGDRPRRAAVDLSLRPGADVTAAAVAVDGDDHHPFVGARQPDVPTPCHLDDPQPRAWRPPPPPRPRDPVADYRARDARALLELMTERARTTMVPWDAGDPSDLVQMLFELLAERLDHLAYEQERAVAEGFLELARLRRSVEDHARPLDYRADPGLSATAMLRFHIDRAALERAKPILAPDGDPGQNQLLAALADGRPLEIPAGTLVGNDDPSERSILFATESLLTYLEELETVSLTSSLAPGATAARLSGRLERLERGRWLVLSRGRGFAGQVVRVTGVDLETDTTHISWDPRRPTEDHYPAEADADGKGRAVIFGNVVPAHHGVPVADRGGADGDRLEQAMQRWLALLNVDIDGREQREVEMPLVPSVQAPGYPFPGERRSGRRQLRLAVDGDPWTEVDDLSRCGPGDEVYVVRPGTGGSVVVRFGDGVNGAALPLRGAKLTREVTVGGGAPGNVGAFTLNQLVRFGRVGSDESDPEAMILATGGAARDDLVRSIWQVTNPLPAVGGRDPEPLETIRYRAPLGVRDALSAVTLRDYERLLTALDEVAGARARAVDAGVRDLVQVTVLLRDEDTLPEKELLRRWSLVRRRLEEIRLLGFDVEAVPPAWVPLDLDLVIEALPHSEPGSLRDDVIEAIAGNGGLLDPDTTGLGGDVRLSELYQAVQRVAGVRSVRVTRFRRLERDATEHLGDGVIPVGDHEVATVGGPRRLGLGLLTVSVCGGLA